MSVRDTQARLATPGDEVIVPADAGQLACLAAINDADYMIQDEVVPKSGVLEAASLSYDLFKDCHGGRSWSGPDPKGGGGGPPPLYGPQNCRTEQGALSAPEAPEILF